MIAKPTDEVEPPSDELGRWVMAKPTDEVESLADDLSRWVMAQPADGFESLDVGVGLPDNSEAY